MRATPALDSWGLEVPGFFAPATKKHGRRVPQTVSEDVPLAEKKPKKQRVPRTSAKSHAHLVLQDSTPSPPAVPAWTLDPPATPKKPGGMRSFRLKMTPERMTEEESWAALAKINPSKGKKRKTVHKPECGCKSPRSQTCICCDACSVIHYSLSDPGAMCPQVFSMPRRNKKNADEQVSCVMSTTP